MSKRQTEPDSSQRPHKKVKKIPEFRTAVSRGRNSNTSTSRDSGASRLTSTSTIVTLSQNEGGGRRRGSGRYRNRQDTSKDTFLPPDIEAGNVIDSSEMFSGT